MADTTSPLLKTESHPQPKLAPPSYSMPYPAQTYSVYEQESPAPRRSPARRFFRAFIFAFATLALFKLVFHHTRRHSYWHGPYDSNELPIPSNVKIHDCVEGDLWSDDPSGAALPGAFSSYTSFELPVSSDLLLFLARGSTSHGNIAIISSDDVGDVAKVDVSVEYYRQKIRDQARVCLLERGEGETGVGIFTPVQNHRHHWHSKDRLSFTVVITLPASSDGSPLFINNLETDMPIFGHALGDLDGSVVFKSLSLKTTNSPIEAQSLYAEDASLRTSNAPISGTFKTSTSLTLSTSNAPIKAEVDLINDKDDHATELVVKTSNAPVYSNVTLESTRSIGGKFDVGVATSNNIIDVKFPSTPVESDLQFEGTTSNSPAYVQLDSAYEGTFSLVSSILSPRLERSEVEDPTGQGRERSIEYRSVNRRGATEGSIKWLGEGRHGQGSVSVKTSNSPVVLKV